MPFTCSTGGSRLSDNDILKLAGEEERVILTHDLDFGVLLSRSKSRQPSIITFRLSNMVGGNVLQHLRATLAVFEEELASGAAVTVTDRKARARILPI